MVFRFTARKIFLTYPQCPLEKQEALNILTSKLPVEQHCVAQETHEDGNKHLHILLIFTHKYNTTNERAFDLNEHHPNIQRPRSQTAVHKYCHKEDESPLCTIEEKNKVWVDAVRATDEESFRAILREGAPREYIINKQQLDCYIKHTFKSKETYQPTYTRFKDLPLQMLAWIPIRNDRQKTLVINSPARYGKTEWARSLGPHVYLQGVVQYDKLCNIPTDTAYIIFDDLYTTDFTWLKPYIGCQREITITGKYRVARQIAWGYPLIILTNTEFWKKWAPEEQVYFNDNTIYINLIQKLY